MNSPLLEVSDLSKSYPRVHSKRERLAALWQLLRGRPLAHNTTILDGINLTVRRGCSLGIIGENGAGKSTLLKIISGVIAPTSGSVSVRGKLGALLELGAGFHPEYSGRDNIRMSAALMGLTPAEIKSKLPQIIDFADIGEYIDEPIKHYSSGMVVRLGFSVMAAMSPELLITDEVLAVGDEAFQKKCSAWLETYLGQRKGTLLMVSHSMYHVQKLCTEAIWIEKGRIRKSGDAFEVTQDYLAYHEGKARLEQAKEWTKSGLSYRVESLLLNDGFSCVINQGADLTVSGTVRSPDDRAPHVALGVIRNDGTPVYGFSSETDGVRLARKEPGIYAFAVRLVNLPLLPGNYQIRAHGMDPEGLRLQDTEERDLIVRGKARETGLCRLDHEWCREPRGEVRD